MFETDATHLPRLMICGGSSKLGGEVPPDNTNQTRREGIAAHELAKLAFDRNCIPSDYVGQQASNGIFYTDDMTEHVGDYLAELTIRRPDFMHLEYSADFGNENFKIKTRADAISGIGSTLFLDDFKYGYRFIEPVENYTMIAQAIAFVVVNNLVPETIKFTIHQPRGFNHHLGKVRIWEISYSKLIEYYEKIATRLSNLPDTLVTSKHCYNCPAVATCVANRAAEMNAIEAALDFHDATISDEMLSLELDLLSRAAEIIKERKDAMEELATHRVRNGHVIQNYTLEHQTGNRAWNDGITPEVLQILTGKDLTKKKLVSPAQAEKSGVSKEIVATLAHKPNIGYKLKRRDTNETAIRLLQQKG